MGDCPVTDAWKIIGKPWRIVIIARLLNGAKTYSDLLWTMKGISSRTLCKALRELEKENLIEVKFEGGKKKYYTLTQKGRELENVIEHLRKWGEKWLR